MAFSSVGQNVLRIFRGESPHKDNRPRKYKCQQLLEKEFELKRKCRVVRIWHFAISQGQSLDGKLRSYKTCSAAKMEKIKSNKEGKVRTFS